MPKIMLRALRKQCSSFIARRRKRGGFGRLSARGVTGVHVYDCRKREEKERQGNREGPSVGKEADEISKRKRKRRRWLKIEWFDLLRRASRNRLLMKISRK